MLATNFALLRALDAEYDKLPHTFGILSGEEVSLIRQTLRLEEMDVLQLRNLRDFAVLLYSTQCERDGDGRASFKKMDKISAVTAVIDAAIYNKGGIV